MDTAAKSPLQGPARREISYLNALRVGAIYLVVLLHAVAPGLKDLTRFGSGTWWACDLIDYATRAGVPLFFMLSGFLLLSDERTLDLGYFYRRRLGRLLPPFLIWDVFYYLFGCFSGGSTPALLPFLQELTGRGSGYHLWFVYQIMAIYLLVPFLKRIVDHCKERELWVLLGVILLPTTVFQALNFFQSYVYFDSFLPLMEGYVGFFLFGYLLGRSSPGRGARICLYLGGVAGWIIGAVVNFLSSSPDTLNLALSGGYTFTHYLTAGALFVLARQVMERCRSERTAAALSRLSKLSFGVFFIHPLILKLAVWLTPDGLHPLAAMGLQFIFTALGSTGCIYLLSKIKPLKRLLM